MLAGSANCLASAGLDRSAYPLRADCPGETCNDHVLVVLADSNRPDARLNVEGTDLVLIVMPEHPRKPGAVTAYLVGRQEVADAARTTHREWLSTNPSAKGDKA